MINCPSIWFYNAYIHKSSVFLYHFTCFPKNLFYEYHHWFKFAMCYFLNGKTERLCCWPWTTSLCHLQSTPTLEDHLGDLSRPAFFQRTEVLIVLFQWPIYFFSPFLEFGIGSGTQIFKKPLNVIKLISMPCIYFLFLNLINIRIGWRCCFRSF